MLTGFAAGAETISRSIIEEVADTFDLLPSAHRGRQLGEEREAASRIFTASGRAELWAAGAGVADDSGRPQTSVAGAAQTRHEEEMEREFIVQGEASGASDGAKTPDGEDLSRAFSRWDKTGGS
jgi:hypothetical protein